MSTSSSTVSSVVTSAPRSGTFPPIITPTPAITSEKLVGSSNYIAWSRSVKLWFRGQGYEHHLTSKLETISTADKPDFQKVDALLCNLLLQSIDPKLNSSIYQAYDTCYEIWGKAKSLYTNDIQRLFTVVSNMVHLKQDDDMSDFVGKLQSMKQELDSLLTVQDPTDYSTQIDKLIMVFGLTALRPELASVRDQILAGSVVPSLDDLSARLLRIASTTLLSTHSSVEPIGLASHTNPKGDQLGGRGIGHARHNRPKCSYCQKLGHTKDRCYKLHGRPPRTANVAQIDPYDSKPTSEEQSASVVVAASEYEDYLRYKATQQSSASVAHTGNSVACLTQSPGLGPWVLDSGASDHISGNKDLFSHLTYPTSLPYVTLANGSRTMAKGIGQALLLPSLTLDSVLYVPHCPFNLISVSKLTRTLNCSITFLNDSVIIQDRDTGQMIGAGRESQGLYHFNTPSSSVACTSTESATLIHSRLGHPGLSNLQKMVPSLSYLSSLECESCQLGKQPRVSFPKRVNNRATSPFEIVHSDIWGPSRVPSVLGFQYFVTFIDDYSRCTWLYLLKNRSDVFSVFKEFCAEIKTQFNVSIRVLRSDNAREYFSTSFTTFMASQGILHQSSCAYTPQQNGVAERKNRHLIETARTLLLHYNVPFRFWADAVLTACYLINRMPSSVLQHQIPFSILYPSQSLYLLPPRVFGCVCFVHNLAPGQDKFSARSIKCVFLGYSRVQKGYRCYSPTTHRFYISADVTFFESSPYFTTSSDSASISHILPIPYFGPPLHTTAQSDAPLVSDSPPPVRPLQVYSRRSRLPSPSIEVVPSDPPAAPTSPRSTVQSDDASLPLALRKGIRSTKNPYPIYTFLSYHRLSPSYYSLVSTLSSVSIPRTTSEALSDPGWRQAMIDEMTALHSSGTWDLVPLPSGKSTVGCRWVYTIKVGPDGQIDRLKARLVAKGYTQIFGLDYGDTFSPVAKIASVRLFLSLAAMHHWPLYQLDIKNAFLHGELMEEVYMEQPPGFVAQGESGLVCRLRRSLYGLKQSPRAWFSRFSTVIQEFGMIRSEADHSVFYRHESHGKCILLVVYVDDIVITGNDQEGIQQLKQHLFTHFQTKDLGRLKYFLGIEVAQSNSGVVISQRKYALDILEETGMVDCRPVDTPMDPNIKLLPGQGEPLDDPGRYRRLVGKLNYLTITRPDISFAVSVVSQFLQSPCDSHWDAVVRILRYIKGTPGQGLLYEDKGHTQVVGYSDADWAGSPSDRRSTSGYCVLIGGNLISWKSKKQDVVARSSAEAEYRAMALATCELIWLKQLLLELKLEEVGQMKLVCDNQAALHIASNPVFHERTKHIEVDCHFIREKILSGCISTTFVNSSDQLADILTKALRGPRITSLCNKLGAYDLYAPA